MTMRCVNQSRLSVILLGHEAEGALVTAIDSIRAQTLADWELIIMDGSSSTSTRALLARYAARDERIRVFGPTPAGLVDGRARGLQLAGETISTCWTPRM